MKTPAEVPASRQRAILGDFSAALGQQMFFWGRDVLADGNLLIAYGLEKLPSPGLKGTSCYRQRWQCGCIELHGSCAGWYPDDPAKEAGFLYVRTLGRCSAHRRSEPIVPGDYAGVAVLQDVRVTLAAAQRFAAWLHCYETWVHQQQGPQYRQGCREMLSRLPKGKPWLGPQQALKWIGQFLAEGPRTTRAARRR
jgi:hypothetical protein